MKIISLKAENVKRLKAVEIHPDGNVVVVGGYNAQGKSSTMDSIEYALRGKRALPDAPVREGEAQARIILELDDIVVKSTIDSDGSYRVVVTSRDGKEKYNSPQSLLDGLVGKIAFDPLEFSRKPAREQADLLKKLVGLDFSELDRKRGQYYTDRMVAGRDVSGREKQINELPHYPEAGLTERDVTGLIDELRRLQQANAENDRIRAGLETLERENRYKRDELQRGKALVEEAEAAIAKWQAALKTRQESVQQATTEYDAATLALANRMIEIDGLEDMDLAPVNELIAGAEEHNRMVRANVARKQAEDYREEANAQYRYLTDMIDEIDAKKAKMMSEAKFPIPGLGFDTEGVTYNGIPFVQCSSAEQLRISVALGIALNPALPVMLIRDGSLLDPSNLAMIQKMAEEADAQIWIERVGEGEECQVIIEDGQIKENRNV